MPALGPKDHIQGCDEIIYMIYARARKELQLPDDVREERRSAEAELRQAWARAQRRLEAAIRYAPGTAWLAGDWLGAGMPVAQAGELNGLPMYGNAVQQVRGHRWSCGSPGEPH